MRHLFSCTILLVGLTTQASAGIIPYTFSAEIDGLSPHVAAALSLQVGDTITGGFLWDDAAPRTSFTQCDDCNYDGVTFVPGVRTNATYDMSNLFLWAKVGDRILGATGNTLTIQDVPTGTYAPDSWHLDMTAFQQEISDELRTESMHIILNSWFRGPLTNGDLQVPDPTQWSEGVFWDNRFIIQFSGVSGGVGSHLTSIKSVPEPGSLLLLVTAFALVTLSTYRARRQ